MAFTLVSKDIDFRIKQHQYRTGLIPYTNSLQSPYWYKPLSQSDTEVSVSYNWGKHVTWQTPWQLHGTYCNANAFHKHGHFPRFYWLLIVCVGQLVHANCETVLHCFVSAQSLAILNACSWHHHHHHRQQQQLDTGWDMVFTLCFHRMLCWSRWAPWGFLPTLSLQFGTIL